MPTDAGAVTTGEPRLVVTPATIDFGELRWSETASADVDIENVGTGNAPLELRYVGTSNEAGLEEVFATELFVVDPATSTETPATTPLLLVPGGPAARVRLSIATIPLGAGPLPGAALVLATDAPAPDDATKRVPVVGTVRGCAMPEVEVCNGLDDDCDSTTTDRHTPTAVPDLAGVVELALGANHSCARLTNGTVRCWSDNSYSQLGDGTAANRPAPTTTLLP